MAERRPRVCWFNPTKRQGLQVGKVKDEGLAELISVLKAARESGNNVTFFLWEGERGFSLTAGVDERSGDFPQRRGGGAPGYRQIRGGGPAARPIRTAEYRQEDSADETEGGEPAAPAPAAPARQAKAPARGRTLKSVFEGLD